MSATLDRIVIDPDILGGKAHIRGTNLSVSEVIQALADGKSVDELKAANPGLETEDILQMFRYLADLVSNTSE